LITIYLVSVLIVRNQNKLQNEFNLSVVKRLAKGHLHVVN